jgi:hypothetical protein
MSHAFFRGVDWDDVYHKRVPAPFMPTIKGRADTSNFDSEFTSVTPVLTPVQSGKFFLAKIVLTYDDHLLTDVLQCYRKLCKRNSGASLTRRTLFEEKGCYLL